MTLKIKGGLSLDYFSINMKKFRETQIIHIRMMISLMEKYYKREKNRYIYQR